MRVCWCRSRAAVLLAGLLMAGSASAADPVSDSETLALLPHLADEVMVRWDVPGMALAVVRRDGVVFEGGFGVVDRASDTPVTAATVFAVGSVTKGFTALTAAILDREGKLDLDRPVREVLPGFRLQDPVATLQATPRDLLTHRSGLPRHDMVWYGVELQRAQLLAALPELEPAAGLRQRFLYNNLMYLVVGEAVAAVAGQPWEAVLRERLLAPLGMANTSVGAPPKGAVVATPHRVTQDGAVLRVARPQGRSAAPAAGLFSTAGDLASWARMMLGRGRLGDQHVVDERAVAEVITPQVVVPGLGPAEIPLTTYGLGWFVTTYRGHLMAWHGGSIDGYQAYVALLPYDDLGVVVLTNRASHQVPEVVSRWIFDRFLGLAEINWFAALRAEDQRLHDIRHDAETTRQMRLATGQAPTLPLDGYLGRYLHPAYGMMTVEDGGEKLVGVFHGMRGPLEHLGGDIFRLELVDELLDGFVVGFVVEGSRAVALYSPMQSEVQPIVFRRIPDSPAAASTTEGSQTNPSPDEGRPPTAEFRDLS